MSRVKTAGRILTVFYTLFLMSCSSGNTTLAPAPINFDQDLSLRKRDHSHVGEGEGIHLSQALEKNLKTEAITHERLSLVKSLVKAQSLPKAKKNLAYQDCLNKFNQAPECNFLKPDWVDTWFEDDATTDGDDADTEIALKASQRSTDVKLTKKFRRQHAKTIDLIVKNLKAGKIEKVPGQVEGDYFRAFKHFKTWTPELTALTEKILAEKSCLEPELYSYLGLKGEEFFPNDQNLKSSMALYSKADQCAIGLPNNKYAQVARFRLGLLSVMTQDCTKAEDVFTRLSKSGVNDYSTRALYWNAYCERSESKREEFLATFDELFRMNPLGFHTLTVTHGDSLLIENLSKPIDPIIKSRTTREGQFNVWIGLLEDLDNLGEHGLVNRLLAPVRKSPEYVATLEPGVRLYLATFAYRSSDMISLFRILDSVFRTQSEYVVDSTLKLFYPMRHFDQITKNVKKVNPLLIAALIRQESAFQDNAKSRVGAVGLMQLMPATARLLERKVKKNMLFTPEVNLRIGIKYFEALVERYNGDVELALAAYNAGSDIVDRWQKRYPVQNRLLFLDLIPFAETRNYVTLIGRNYYWYSQIYSDALKASKDVAQMEPVQFRAMKSQ